MSEKAVQQFCQLVLKNEDLQEEIQRLVNDLVRSLAQIAEKRGCKFIPEELRELIQENLFGDKTKDPNKDEPIVAALRNVVLQIKTNRQEAEAFSTLANPRMMRRRT